MASGALRSCRTDTWSGCVSEWVSDGGGFGAVWGHKGPKVRHVVGRAVAPAKLLLAFMLHHADVPRVGLALGGIGRLEQSGDKRHSVRQPAGADKVAAMSRGGGEAMRVLTLQTGRTSMLAPARIRMAPVMTAVTSPNTSPRRPIVPRARRQYTLVLAIKSCTGAPSLSGMCGQVARGRGEASSSARSPLGGRAA